MKKQNKELEKANRTLEELLEAANKQVRLLTEEKVAHIQQIEEMKQDATVRAEEVRRLQADVLRLTREVGELKNGSGV